MPTKDEQDYQDYLAYQKYQAAAKAPPEPSVPEKVLHGVSTALNYPGGLVRGALGSAAGQYQSGDLGKILSGQAPTTSEYLGRAGVPEGYKLSDVLSPIYSDTGSGLTLKKGGSADPSVRDVAGFVGDVALDPLTYLSGGLSAAAKGEKAVGLGSRLASSLSLANDAGLTGGGKLAHVVLNPIESFSLKHADSLYNKAFDKLDLASEEKLNKPKTISDILKDANFFGDPQDALHKVQEIHSNAGKEIGNIYKQASGQGATVDLKNGFKDTEALLNKLKTSPDIRDVSATEQLQTILDGYKAKGEKIPPHLANEWKSDINAKAAKSGIFNVFSSPTVQPEFEAAIGKDLKRNIEKSVASKDPSLYEKLKNANQTFGSTDDQVQKLLLNKVNTEMTRKSPVSAVDLMLLGAGGGLGIAGAGASGGATLGALAAKKAGQAMMSTKGRTLRGAIANQIGQKSNGIVDSAARQAIWDHLLNQQEGNK